LSFDPVDVAWMVPWYVKVFYLTAVIAVIAAVRSSIPRLRRRVTHDSGRTRGVKTAHLVFLLSVMACGVATVLFRVGERERVLHVVLPSAQDAQSVRDALAHEYRSDAIVGVLAVGGALVSFVASGPRNAAA